MEEELLTAQPEGQGVGVPENGDVPEGQNGDIPEGQNGDAPEGQNGEAPESDQVEQSDGLLSQDKLELSERVAHIEKRVREQQDEIVCLKGAMADVMRRLGTVETTKKQPRVLPMRPNPPSSVTPVSDKERNPASVNMEAQNSILPSKPYLTSPRRAPSGKERPKSTISESRSSAPTSARQPPRGASAGTVKKWGSMSNSIEDTNGHKSPRSGSQLTRAKRSSSQGALHIKSTLTTKGSKGPTFNRDDKSVRMYLKGRPVTLYAPLLNPEYDDYKVNGAQEPPAEKLQLEWVYGYRGRDARSNLYQLPTGEVIYFSAAVVVLHNIQENGQRHYTEHTDDVKCLAIHPDKVRIATGQVAGHEKKEGKPHVRIWNSVSLKTLCVIGADPEKEEFQRAVCCVSFCNNRLLAVDESNDHVLSVWDIRGVTLSDYKKQPSKIADMKSSGDPVTACEFNPKDEDSIVCCGKSQISFWSLENKENNYKLNKRSGIFGGKDKGAVIICFAFNEEGNVISGDSNGNIHVWEKGSNKIKKSIDKAHKGGVFSICVLKDGSVLSGGGKDRMVYQWDAEMENISKQTEISEEMGGVRMISEGQGTLFVGTIRNCILQSTVDQSNAEFDFRPVVQGHKEELWGLACLPDSHKFLTCGYDKHIYLWDAQSRTPLKVKEIAESAHCCAVYKFDDDNCIGVVGNQSGKWIVIDLETKDLDVIAVYTDGKEQHECVEFSPDGKMLAIGNRDNYIYVYEVSENGRKYKKIGRCSGNSSYITHIDWSVDSTIIRSNSGDYAVLYWDAARCKQNTDNDVLRDTEFATTNCTLAFNSIGVWPDGADGTDVNNCSVNNKKSLIVSADDFGKVNLYEYPSVQISAEPHSYQGHSSHVTTARFLFDDSRIISTGGRDMAVLQWLVV